MALPLDSNRAQCAGCSWLARSGSWTMSQESQPHCLSWQTLKEHCIPTGKETALHTAWGYERFESTLCENDFIYPYATCWLCRMNKYGMEIKWYALEIERHTGQMKAIHTSTNSSGLYRLGTSPELRMLLISSRKDSSTIWVSLNRKTVGLLSTPAKRYSFLMSRSHTHTHRHTHT